MRFLESFLQNSLRSWEKAAPSCLLMDPFAILTLTAFSPTSFLLSRCRNSLFVTFDVENDRRKRDFFREFHECFAYNLPKAFRNLIPRTYWSPDATLTLSNTDFCFTRLILCRTLGSTFLTPWGYTCGWMCDSTRVSSDFFYSVTGSEGLSVSLDLLIFLGGGGGVSSIFLAGLPPGKISLLSLA